MKNLKEYIIEGIFDVNDNIHNIDKSIKDQIKQFLKDNFNGGSLCRISRKPNTDGKYEVSSNKTVKTKHLDTPLTNGYFIWTNVDGDFIVDNYALSLDGCPKKVGGNFVYYGSRNGTSLINGPEEVGGDFEIHGVLLSLDGCPKKVGGYFKLPKKCKFTIDDVSKICDIGKFTVSSDVEDTRYQLIEMYKKSKNFNTPFDRLGREIMIGDLVINERLELAIVTNIINTGKCHIKLDKSVRLYDYEIPSYNLLKVDEDTIKKMIKS